VDLYRLFQTTGGLVIESELLEEEFWNPEAGYELEGDFPGDVRKLLK
jgi:hypothetical protein